MWCSVSESKQRQRFSDAWLLDSECTYHMCSKNEWFSTYEPFERGKVLMGNNIACKTIGIGSIRMKMFDGQVWTLKNVKHVSNLRKNLLSLGVLKAQECKFSGMAGAIKVTEGSMMVLKAERTTNLYKEIGSVVIGDASVATEDTTKLWHMHFRHMSKRCLRALHSKSVLPGIKHCKLNLCKFYIMCRQSRIIFTISVHKTKGLLDLIHTDV